MIPKFSVLLLVACQIASQETTNRGVVQSTNLPTPSDRASLVSTTQLDRWVAKWQRRLDLTSWRIRTNIVRKAKMKKDCIASITWNRSEKTAILKVLDAQDSSLTPQAFVRDTELSVVHELTHLSMSILPLDSVNQEQEEEVVKKISKALMELSEERDSRVLLTSR